MSMGVIRTTCVMCGGGLLILGYGVVAYYLGWLAILFMFRQSPWLGIVCIFFPPVMVAAPFWAASQANYEMFWGFVGLPLIGLGAIIGEVGNRGVGEADDDGGE